MISPASWATIQEETRMRERTWMREEGKRKAKENGLKRTRERETDSKPSWNFLFGICDCSAYLPLDTPYLSENCVFYTCITTTKQTSQTCLFWSRAAKAVTARSQIFIADFIKSSH